MLAGIFIILFLLALLAAKPGERLPLAKAIFYASFVLLGAQSLRRFKIRIG